MHKTGEKAFFEGKSFIDKDEERDSANPVQRQQRFRTLAGRQRKSFVQGNEFIKLKASNLILLYKAFYKLLSLLSWTLTPMATAM